MSQQVFYYDVSSPYAYLAAKRMAEHLPAAEWRPIAFGFLLRETGRVPWSLRDDTRDAGIAVVERCAAERGLPPVKWPAGWPAESYSVTPLRALYFAEEAGLLKELTLALYDKMFVEGVPLNDVETVIDAGVSVGLDRDEMRANLDREAIKQRLKAETDAAIARGVVGVPTIAIGDTLFWGDDQLEPAAAHAA